MGFAGVEAEKTQSNDYAENLKDFPQLFRGIAEKSEDMAGLAGALRVRMGFLIGRKAGESRVIVAQLG
jgi:hypothetical protein